MPAYASPGGDCLEQMRSCTSSEKPDRCRPTNCWSSSSVQDETTRHQEESPTQSAGSTGEGGSSTPPTGCGPSLIDNHTAGQHAINNTRRTLPTRSLTDIP